MISLLLLAWAAVLAGPVARRLAASRWVYRAPRVGVAAWRVVAVNMVGSLLMAGLTALLHWDRTHDLVCGSWQICLDTLNGAHGRLAPLVTAVGRPVPRRDATVIPDARPAAYLVPGRHGRVVVTAGAVELLPSEQLDAVLA